MATSWTYYTSGDYVGIGIDFNVTSTSDTAVVMAPKIYRYDKYDTANTGSKFSEKITKVSGSGTDSWSGIGWGTGSGKRTVDTFSSRTYPKQHSAYTVTLTVEADSSFGTAYSGSFHTVGAKTKSVSYTIPAKTHYTVSYSANGGSGAPSAQTKWYGESLTLSSTAPTRAGYTFAGWNTKADGTGTNYAAGASYSSNAALALYAKWTLIVPTAPTACTVSRVSDVNAYVSWTLPSGYTVAKGCIVERRTDGGVWSKVGTLSGDATSWSDTAVSADHFYQYRVCRIAYDDATKSAYAESSSVYMTPSAPLAISLSRASGSTVDVVLENRSGSATSLEWGVSTDASSWSTETPISGLVTAFQASGLVGTYYVRVRNANATGASQWLVSDPIVTIAPPNPPILDTPRNGQPIDMSAGNPSLRWLHNPVDGSAQTAAELQWAKNGGAYTTVSLTTAQQWTLPLSGISQGDEIRWRVRTKGAHADWSGWSAVSVFNAYTRPTVSITSPGATVTAMPISLTASYSDMAGFSCASATVSLYEGDTLVYSEPCTVSGGTISETLTEDEFTPANGTDYTVVLDVRSSSSLTSRAQADFHTSWLDPMPGYLEIENDPETGYCNAVVRWDAADDSHAEAVSATVKRGGIVFLKDSASGGGFCDRNAPLNVAYEYTVSTVSASGTVNRQTIINSVGTDRFFFYGSDGTVASGRFNPQEGGISVSRPQKTLVHYAGRGLPVSYDGAAWNETHSPAFDVLSVDDAEPFLAIVRNGGRGVYKSPLGYVMHADIEVNVSPEYAPWFGGVKLSITRIDGGEL